MSGACWPETLRTAAFVYAGCMSAEQLRPFYLSPQLRSRLGWEADMDPGAFDELADALAEEYTRLFVGPHHHHPPSEGLARGDGQLLGDRAIEVRLAYQAAGYEPIADSGLLPDHISMELDFVAVLIEREAAEAAREFVRTHLNAWVPGWVGEYSPHARFRFYPAIGEILCQGLGEIG